MSFEFDMKAGLLFGVGTSEQIGERLKQFQCTKVICVFDPGIEATGIPEKIMEHIRAAGIETVAFGNVLPDPPDTLINECGELGRNEKVDGVVGIGGGSSMDTAKALNILLSNPGPIEDYMVPQAPHNPSKPMILIPTTSGTASEITRVSVVSNTRQHTKDGIMGPATVADLAIVDPALTLKLPPAITASTGLDALAHAIESYTSTAGNPISDTLAQQAIEVIAKALPRAVENGEDIDARTQMSYGCTLAGIAFNNAFPHFAHALGHALGTFYKVPHGAACAVGLPSVIRLSAKAFPHKVKNIGARLGTPVDASLDAEQAGAFVADSLSRLIAATGSPSLKGLNIENLDIPALAAKTMEDFTFNFVPQKMDLAAVQQEIEAIYNAG